MGSVQWTRADNKLDCLRDLERNFCHHKHCIGTGSVDQVPPAAGQREIKRLNSEAGDDEAMRDMQEKERAQTWARAQTERRKYVKVVCFGAGNNDDNMKNFCSKEEGSPLVAGTEHHKAGREHRMVHLSADSWGSQRLRRGRRPRDVARS